MKNKKIIETIKEGIPVEEFEKALAENAKEVYTVSAILTSALAVEPIFYPYGAPELVLGAIISGINGMAVANIPKEKVMSIVEKEYDTALEKMGKYLKELESSPDEESALSKRVKEIHMATDTLAILPTDGKVH